jgi:hypothetical protein
MEPFPWGSFLGIAVALFLVWGAIYVIIGVLTPVLMNRGITPQILIFSSRTDTALFGATPNELLRDNAPLATFRTILLRLLAGVLVGTGVLLLAVTWYGLRTGRPWALGTLALTGLVVLAYWWLAYLPYARAGVQVGLGDVPPFMWIPAALLVPAVILGWLGLR